MVPILPKAVAHRGVFGVRHGMMGRVSGHSHLRVDLGAIAHNLRCVRSRVGERAILAAVKANAYGHGAVAVARHIEDHQLADGLGVALVSEAAELRAAGITLPLVKFTPTLTEELPDALAADLSLTVVDATSIREAAHAAEAAEKPVQVHLKLDTGMRRVGAPAAHAVELAQQIRDAPWLELTGLMTHLPVSDVPEGAEFTGQQLESFERAGDEVRAAVGEVPLVSAANSGAVLIHPLGSTTMVRPGIMVYGCYPDPATPRTVDLVPAATWTSRVLFVKQVATGETVGYGRTWTAPRETWIATVGIGYGDGYSRLLSNRGSMLIDGVRHPIVGRVCMDQTMIDLGRGTPRVQVGDEVVLVGRSGDEEITVADLAELMGTITYEVTSLIAPRVRRTYQDSGGSPSVLGG